MPLPTPKNDPLFGHWAGVMPKLDRLALATKFVMADAIPHRGGASVL
jgi:hypothetical protein